MHTCVVGRVREGRSLWGRRGEREHVGESERASVSECAWMSLCVKEKGDFM